MATSFQPRMGPSSKNDSFFVSFHLIIVTASERPFLVKGSSLFREAHVI